MCLKEKFLVWIIIGWNLYDYQCLLYYPSKGEEISIPAGGQLKGAQILQQDSLNSRYSLEVHEQIFIKTYPSLSLTLKLAAVTTFSLLNIKFGYLIVVALFLSKQLMFHLRTACQFNVVHYISITATIIPITIHY